MLNARITFGNIFAGDTPVDGVTTIQDDGYTQCTIDDSCFDAPLSYIRLGKYGIH